MPLSGPAASGPNETAVVAALAEDVVRTDFVTPRPAAPGPPSGAYLVPIFPKTEILGRRYLVGPDPVLVGRGGGAVHSLDPSVSRTHARVEVRPDGRFQVVDLDSTNGTFVNDVRVRSQVLRDGDDVQFGNVVFRFLESGNAEAEYHEEIHRLAVRDPLTGVYNRRALADHLAREAARARPLAVLLFDIDHFKVVNDRFGHLAGDATLRALTATALRLIRAEDLLARYGGEEFAVVLPETTTGQAHACGERLRAEVAARPFEYDRHRYPVTVSVGVAGSEPGACPAPGDLLRLADERLYRAKLGGRNRVCSG